MSTITIPFTTIRARVNTVANELNAVVQEKRVAFGPGFQNQIVQADFMGQTWDLTIKEPLPTSDGVFLFTGIENLHRAGEYPNAVE